jgi:hypothetical protein
MTSKLSIPFITIPCGVGGAATSNQKAATPNRAVRMAGASRRPIQHDCDGR